MKKNRKQKSIKGNFKRWKLKCSQCVSFDKEKQFCKDLEFAIKDVWKSPEDSTYKCGKCNRRCSFFVNKFDGNKVKIRSQKKKK